MSAGPVPHARQRPARPVGRARDVDRDRRILQAVLDLLGEQAPGAISMEEVAVRADVAKSTVYRRWGSAADLLADAVDTLEFPASPIEVSGHLRNDLVEALISATGCLDDRRQRIIRGILGAVGDQPEMVETLRLRFVEAVAGALTIALRGALPGAPDGGATADPPYEEIELAVVIGLMTSLPQVTGRSLGRADFEAIVDRALMPLLRARSSATPTP